MLNANKTGYFPYTPALPLFYGLREALAVIEEEGLDNIIARHHYLAEGAEQPYLMVGVSNFVLKNQNGTLIR